MASITIDIQAHVDKAVAEVRAAVTASYTEILFDAYTAGHAKGYRTGAYGRDEFGSFDEWLAEIIEPD